MDLIWRPTPGGRYATVADFILVGEITLTSTQAAFADNRNPSHAGLPNWLAFELPITRPAKFDQADRHI
jgi:hypothetical protein